MQESDGVKTYLFGYVLNGYVLNGYALKTKK